MKIKGPLRGLRAAPTIWEASIHNMLRVNRCLHGLHVSIHNRTTKFYHVSMHPNLFWEGKIRPYELWIHCPWRQAFVVHYQPQNLEALSPCMHSCAHASVKARTWYMVQMQRPLKISCVKSTYLLKCTNYKYMVRQKDSYNNLYPLRYSKNQWRA